MSSGGRLLSVMDTHLEDHQRIGILLVCRHEKLAPDERRRGELVGEQRFGGHRRCDVIPVLNSAPKRNFA